MITVYSFTGGWGLPSVSPFCAKVETWLRMVELPHTTTRAFNPFKAPKGKAPYVVDGDGEVIADSTHIIARLGTKHGVDLDVGLSDADRALATLIQRTLEDHLYFILVHARWMNEAEWPTVREVYFGGMGAPGRWIAPVVARRGVRKTLHLQGTGRHSRQELLDAARADIDALAALLGDKPFFLGEQPRTVDAIASSFVEGLLRPPIARDFAALAAAHPNLVAYSARMRERYWADLP